MCQTQHVVLARLQTVDCSSGDIDMRRDSGMCRHWNETAAKNEKNQSFMTLAICCDSGLGILEHKPSYFIYILLVLIRTVEVRGEILKKNVLLDPWRV